MDQPLNRPVRNPELTKKGFDAVILYGRNFLDDMTRKKSKKEMIEEGWIKDLPEDWNKMFSKS
jgi:hypothetical protein